MDSQSLVPWAWGVNGFFTVIGTVVALIMGMAFGFRAVLIFAAFCYVGAYAAMIKRRKSTVVSEQAVMANGPTAMTST
jgi:hypothetical protein